MRHNVRRRFLRPGRDYVKPSRLVGARDAWGQPVPGQWDESPLPEALFAPGASSEETMLSDVTEHKARLFFHEYVPVDSSDRIRIPGHGDWAVVGRPNHWRMGTVLMLERAT
ncbi:hypothetical protein GCM10027061_21610 [Nesterenkonia suensis]